MMAGTLLPPCGRSGEVPAVIWIQGSVIVHEDQGPGSC